MCRTNSPSWHNSSQPATPWTAGSPSSSGGRSARPGDVGEFIATRVFNLELATTATQAGYDGSFRSGPLAGKTVNVKTYGDVLGGLDIGARPCDYTLVLTGPPGAEWSRGARHHGWASPGCICSR